MYMALKSHRVSGSVLGMFTDIISFNPHINNMTKVLSQSTFYTERNRTTEVMRLVK